MTRLRCGFLGVVVLALVALSVVAFGIAASRDGGESSPETPDSDLAISEVTPTPVRDPSSTPERPDGTSTGVIPGTVLVPSEGFVIDVDGTVVEGLDVTGCIDVQANDVTIRNTRVTGACWNGAINTGDGEYSGILIEDVEVDGAGSIIDAALVGRSGFTCRRCNVHGGASGFRMADDVAVEDSYVHDLSCPQCGHNTAIGSNGGTNYVIRNNTLDNNVGGSAVLALYGDYSPISDVLVENNLFVGGGSYTVYGGSVPDKAFPVADNVRFIDNEWSRSRFPDGGQYGPIAAFDPTAPGAQWSNNRFDDGQAIG